jgi:OOP family OmpA-OmpF porin
MVDIIGHTDTVGSDAINAKVSLKRARFIEVLVRKENIKILSLVSKGYGEEDLLVQTRNNKSEEKNRNVEIFIK